MTKVKSLSLSGGGVWRVEERRLREPKDLVEMDTMDISGVMKMFYILF